MKKLTTLLLAAGMVFAASAPASAVDVKMDGEYMFTYGIGERMATGSNFDVAGQRVRIGMTFTANENLSGYLADAVLKNSPPQSLETALHLENIAQVKNL